MSPIHQHYADRRICIAFWRNVAIVDVRGAIDMASATTLGSAYAKLVERHPAGIAALVMLRAGTPVASHETRAEIARFSKELGSSLLRVTMVVEDRGVLAQMLRAVVRGISVVVRQTRIQMVDDLDSAIVATLPVISTSAQVNDLRHELAKAIQQVRFSFQPSMRAS